MNKRETINKHLRKNSMHVQKINGKQLIKINTFSTLQDWDGLYNFTVEMNKRETINKHLRKNSMHGQK